jgi:hypothetical protein
VIGSIAAARRRSGAGASATTLDPDDVSAAMTLSGGNLVATHANNTTPAYAIGKDGKSSGKWYFEVTPTVAVGDLAAGIVGAGMMPYPYLGWSAQSIGVNSISVKGVVTSGGTAYTHSGFSAGDVMGVFVDIDNSKVWFSKNGSVLSGDPHAGTGGTTMSSMDKAWYPAVFSAVANSVMTCNFGVSSGSFAAWTPTTPPASLATFRAIRMGIRSLGYFAHAFAEVELMTSSGGANLLSGSTGSASFSPGDTLSKGYDGNTTTFTFIQPGFSGSDMYAGWFGWDLLSSATRNASHFALRGRAGGGGNELQTPTLVNLYASVDNISFWKVKAGIAFTAFAGTTPGQRQEAVL